MFCRRLGGDLWRSHEFEGKSAMSKQRIITCCAVAALASAAILTPALATAPQGLSVNGIVSGSFGKLSLNTAGNKTGKWGMILKTLDDTDVGADEINLAAGGYTGWHSHPSAVFVTVTAGSIVWFDGSDPACPGHTYTVGQSFIEDVARIHNAFNASESTPAQFKAIHINPTGTSGPNFVINEDEPTNCAAQNNARHH
jgi:quercetin dioxygenase-like cupin family protein